MYAVTAAAVQVTVGGRVHLCARGSYLPEGVADETAKALLAKGLIKESEPAEPTPETPAAEGEKAKPETPAAAKPAAAPSSPAKK